MQGNDSWLCRACQDRFFSPCLDHRPCPMNSSHQMALPDAGEDRYANKAWKYNYPKKPNYQRRLR